MKHLTLAFTITSLASISSLGLSGCNNYRPMNPHGPHTSVSTNPSDSHHKNNTADSSHSQPTEHHAVWSYDAQTGPDFWGDMEGFEACKIGVEQSPIDIDKVSLNTSNVSFPKTSFGINDLVISDNGHSIVYTPQIDSYNNNVTSINGDIYTLKQFHYHVPSEHEIAGMSYPAELHFVHANADNNLAVIGVMLQPELDNSLANPSLDKILAGSREAHLQGEAFLASQVDINKLLPSDTGFYHYAGSLTTPPCSEQVQWYVAKTPLTVSVAQLAVLQTLYEGNNRPTQPVGQRDIELLLK